MSGERRQREPKQVEEILVCLYPVWSQWLSKWLRSHLTAPQKVVWDYQQETHILETATARTTRKQLKQVKLEIIIIDYLVAIVNTTHSPSCLGRHWECSSKREKVCESSSYRWNINKRASGYYYYSVATSDKHSEISRHKDEIIEQQNAEWHTDYVCWLVLVRPLRRHCRMWESTT